MKVYCMFHLESPLRDDSNDHTITIFNLKKKITLNYPKSLAMGLFPRTQERNRNSRSKRTISVRTTKGLLYYVLHIYGGEPVFLIALLLGEAPPKEVTLKGIQMLQGELIPL